MRPAVGIKSVHGRSLGLRRRQPGKPTLRLQWNRGTPPPHPPSADHMTGWKYAMDGNDKFGVCGPTSVDMHRRMTTAIVGLAEQDATQDDVFDLYRRSGNPTFDPTTGVGDDGVDMGVMGQAVTTGGISGVRALAFARLGDVTDESVAAAIHVFGGVLYAVTLETAQQAQTNAGTWDFRRSPVWGGHAILCASYDTTTGITDVETWDARVHTTKSFRAQQLDEVWLPIWPELVSSGRFFDSGVDISRFAQDFLELTGKPFPHIPTSDGRVILDPAARTYSFPAGWSPAG